MARSIYQDHLPLWKGDFVFDSFQLMWRIQSTKKGYRINDPKTWPVITAQYLERQLGKPYDGTKMLPLYVAYDRELILSCLARRPVDKIPKFRDGKLVMQDTSFFRFPFMFDSNGIEKRDDVMHEDDQKEWVTRYFLGPAAIQSKSDTSSTAAGQEIDNLSNRARDRSNTISPQPISNNDHTPVASQAPFDEILKMIKGSEHVLSQGPMKAELSQAYLDLEVQKRRVTVAERDRDWLKASLTQERERSQELAQDKEFQQGEWQRAVNREIEQHTVTKRELKSAQQKITALVAACEKADTLADTAEYKIEEAEDMLARREQTLQAIIDKKKQIIRARTQDYEQVNSDNACMETAFGNMMEAKVALEEQMTKIRDEMKKAGFDGGQKRKADDDVSGSRGKKRTG